MHPNKISCAFVSLFVLSASLLAQTTTPPSDATGAETTAPDQTDITVLSPFIVSSEKDVGYQAVDTMSGGRLAVNLLASPSDVTALTRDFLDDIGATQMEEIGAWLTGSMQTELSESRDFGNALQFRGLSTGVNTRNYFRYDTSIETYAMERVEQSRGPNAIQYGESNAGGAVAVTTKQAKFRNFGSFVLKTDHRGSLYSALDINRKLSDKLAARLNLFGSRTEPWFDRGRDERQGAFLSATYQPWKNTSIRVELEKTRSDRSDFRRFYDQTSRWDGTTRTTGPLAANPAAATGLTRFTADQLVIIQGTNNLYNFRNYAQTSGSNLTLGFDDARPDGSSPFPLLPSRGYQLFPDEYGTETATGYQGIFFEQQLLKGLTLELAADASEVLRDRTQWEVNGNLVRTDVDNLLPDGTANPRVGQKYVETRYQEFTTDQYTQNYRIALAYDLKTSGFNQTFSAVAMRRDGIFDTVDIQEGRTNGTVLAKNNAANRIWYRTYLNDPSPTATSTTSIGGVTIGQWRNRDSRNDSRLDSLVLATVGRYLDNRLTVVAGKRYDHSTLAARSHTTFDTFGDINGYNTTYKDQRTDTLTAGLTYFPVQSLGVYANYAEGFLPINNENPWVGSRGPIDFTVSQVKAAGLRANMFGGALVGSVGYYVVDEKDRQVGSTKTAINNIWNTLANYDPSKVNNVIGGPFSVFNDTQDYKATGYELDLTFNVSKSFRLIANVSVPETKQDNAFPDTIEYYNTNLAEWNAALANPLITTAHKTTIQTNLTNVQNQILAANNGRKVNGSVDYRANIFGTYTFNQGGLKGFSIGGGANVYGKQLIGNTNVSGYDYVYADSYVLGSLVIKYPFKLWKQPVQLQLNVSNLLNYSDANYNGVLVYNGQTYRQNFNYVTPRTFSLSLNARF